MKKYLVLIISIFAFSCFSPGNWVVKKYEAVSLPQKEIALLFKKESIKFFSTISGRSGFKFGNSANPEEDFKELFFQNSKMLLPDVSTAKDVVLSKKIDDQFNKKYVTEFQDTLTLPSKARFIKDFSDIEYALIFNRFEIHYVDCGVNTSNGMPCTPEIQFVVEYQIVSNKTNELIQYGNAKVLYEYIRPQRGAFSSEYPNFLNVRYEEWQMLTKLLLKKVFKGGPFS